LIKRIFIGNEVAMNVRESGAVNVIASVCSGDPGSHRVHVSPGDSVELDPAGRRILHGQGPGQPLLQRTSRYTSYSQAHHGYFVVFVCAGNKGKHNAWIQSDYFV